MSINETIRINGAILRCLAEAEQPLSYDQITEYILTNDYYHFKKGDPLKTISGYLTRFIQKGDSRVKRMKGNNGKYVFYLANNEQQLAIAENTVAAIVPTIKTRNPSGSYKERDLHILLSTYLQNEEIYAKTIFHEKSKNSRENNQKWLHPDMVGVSFLKLKDTCKKFLNTVDKLKAFKLSSYEIKKEISSDYELKKTYFQAVSNSSWANFGYLVAFEFSDALADEMARLNESFGIGIIQIAANPYESKVLYPAKYREIDFRTIDKICNANADFEKFINYIEALLTTPSEKYYTLQEKDFSAFCDSYLKTEEEIVNYCKQKNIPLPDDNSTNGESAN